MEQITKLIGNDKYIVEILEKYRWGYFSNEEITKKYKDSTIVIRYSFNREKDTTSILIKKRSEDEIKTSWIQQNSNSESEIFIKRQIDSRGNWIKKLRIRNGILEDEIYRTINYCR